MALYSLSSKIKNSRNILVKSKTKAVFFDRDGVLNKSLVIKGKPKAPTKFKDFKIYKNLDKLFIRLNNGKYLFLDDSGDTLHFGDELANDGIFSALLQLPHNATTGNLNWKFRVQDINGGFRDSTKNIVVLP